MPHDPGILAGLVLSAAAGATLPHDPGILAGLVLAAGPPGPHGPGMLAGAALTAVALAALLVAGATGFPRLAAAAKPLASTGFLVVALAGGALGTLHGRVVLGALVLGFAGDVLLISPARGPLRAGLLVFLLGHLGYVVAFSVAGISPGAAAVAALLLLAPAGLVLRWLRAHVEAGMRGPVVAYVVVISAMLAAAAGRVAAGGSPVLLGAAVAFYLSDLAVARNRFVAPGFGNRAVGLPLYYGAQLLLAASVAPLP